jgi:hypothetical protein
MITCIVCGCTDENACVDEATGERCAWVEASEVGPICSFCAEQFEDEDAPLVLVELVSDAEADRFLRARRAGA